MSSIVVPSPLLEHYSLKKPCCTVCCSKGPSPQTFTHFKHGGGFKCLDSGYEICSIFLDLRKAFDSVPHRNLLLVLEQLADHPILIKWICSYLTSRVQRVVVNGEISREVHAISGVPQGSVLGPLLFLIYINSASGLLFSPRTYITLYADDILMYKEIRKADDFSSV